MKLIDVYSDNRAPMFLYSALSQRAPGQNISHKLMPTVEKHLEFFWSKPYDHWYLIEREGRLVGSIYLTGLSEIGISLLSVEDYSFIAYLAIQEMFKKHPRDEYFFNVNPANSRLISVLGSGVTHIQNTYRYENVHQR